MVLTEKELTQLHRHSFRAIQPATPLELGLIKGIAMGSGIHYTSKIRVNNNRKNIKRDDIEL